MSASLRRHDTDPSALLEAAFRRIHREHMAEVPIVNPALEVEAVGFSLHQGHWLGVLIAPWFMNLVRVPGPESDWESVRGESRQFHVLPSGTYAFLGSEEAEVGEFQTCSLISPMGQFADMEQALATAMEVLAALLQKPAQEPEVLVPPGPNMLDLKPRAAAGETPASPAASSAKSKLSKREFLFGGLRRDC